MEFNDVRLRYENLGRAIDEAISQVLRDGLYILGPSVRALEREFSLYCGTADAVGVGSGTDALSIALRAIHVGPGDEVLVPAVSAAATAMAVALTGAGPVFVDISADDFNMDPVLCGERRTARARAIVPVHLYGMPARLEEISKAGIPVIEDAAQAHGSEAAWGRCGSFGAAAAFSFYPTKNIGAYGDGGMLVTSDAGIAAQARMLRNYGQREDYDSEIPGQNSRLDELQASILRIQLRKLEEWNLSRRRIAGFYREAFQGLPLGMQSETGRSNYHLFVVTTPQRDELRSCLLSQGIPARVHYPVPLNRQKAFSQFNPEACPNAELLCSRVLSLPVHPFLTDAEAERVVDAVRRFFK
jgi:dTDP-4-amino-4,6-dideoxygalactose transaminase